MKHTKRFAALIAALIALVMLAACAAVPSGNDPDDGTDDQAKPVETAKLTIAGNDISLYTIVYADHSYSNIARVNRIIYTEYDFYKIIAGEIRDSIEQLTGVRLSTARDSKTEEGQYEILVGPTNRSESSTYTTRMSVYKYHNQVKNTKLIVGGGYDATSFVKSLKKTYCWAATHHAWDFVAEYITGQMNQGIAEIDLSADFKQSGTLDLTTVACIGDSITEGWASSNMDVCSYPAALQRTLWQDYIVFNYGASGKTMRDDLADHYVNTGFYNAAVDGAEEFDIVLIMLGTNDSDRDPNFSKDDDKMYNDSALGLAKALTKKNDHIKFVIMNCPVYYGGGNSGSKHVRDLQAKLPALFEENGYDCSFFDMYTFTKDELTKTRFPDSLHPNDEGYSMMGVKLAEVIPQIIAETSGQD